MKQLLLWLIVISLTACSLRQPDVSDWAEQRENVRALSEWDFRGRMAVNVANDPDASGQVSVNWEQEADVSQVRLSGPMGIGAWQLLWEPNRVTVSDKNGEKALEYKGPRAAEEFVRQELGWSFPADSIRYWVRCLSAPGTPANLPRRGEKGELVAFNQYGWRIECGRYGEFDDYVLPTRLTMQGRGVKLRLAVSDWRLPSTNVEIPAQP